MPRTPDRRIEDIDMDEDRMIVLLRPGWRYGSDGTDKDRCHTFSAGSRREIRLEMKNVQPCSCHDCQKAIAGSGRLWS